LKESIERVLRLVQEGKLSPEDGAELIDAMKSQGEPSAGEPAEGAAEPEAEAETGGEKKLTWESLIDSIEKLGRELSTSVDWKKVGEQARTSVEKAAEYVKAGVEKIGKIDIDFSGPYEAKTVELPLSLPDGKTLRIENARGSTKVIGKQPLGTVKATAKFRGGTPEERKERASRFTLMMEESDGAITLRQADESSVEVEFEIGLSGDATLDVRGESGAIQIEDLGGSFTVRSRSGAVRMNRCRGNAELQNTSGNINLVDHEGESIQLESKTGSVNAEQVKGALVVRNASGSIHLVGVEPLSLNAETVAGSIHAELLGSLEGVNSLRSVSGSTHVKVSETANCRVTMNSLRGGVENGLTLTDELRQDRRISGQLGEGKGTLDISSVTGSVHVGPR
jgi:DUF4097 and DUF4098 domain-containing protein YvlB